MKENISRRDFLKIIATFIFLFLMGGYGIYQGQKDVIDLILKYPQALKTPQDYLEAFSPSFIHEEQEKATLWDNQVTEFNNNYPESTNTLFIGTSTIYNLGKFLKNENAPEVSACGLNGARIANIRKRLSLILGRRNPTNIILYVGANDLDELVGGEKCQPEQVYLSIALLVSDIKRSLPQSRIFVAGLFHRPARANLINQENNLNDLLKADKSFTFIYIPPPNELLQQKEQYFLSDKMHLNNEGNRIFFSNITNNMNRQ